MRRPVYCNLAGMAFLYLAYQTEAIELVCGSLGVWDFMVTLVSGREAIHQSFLIRYQTILTSAMILMQFGVL